MEQLTAARWRKYGKDRLYVSTDDGQRVGWVDLLTGQSVLERPELEDAFTLAMHGWSARSAFTIPGQDRRQHLSDGAQDEHAETVAATAPCARTVPQGRPGQPRTAQRTEATAVEVGPADETQPSLNGRAAGALPTADAAAAAPKPADLPERVEPAWLDLSLNVPGQAARHQAEAELAAQRERSRIGSFIARTFDMKTDERAWRVGAGGEETVGARLDKLTKRGWHVLHAVPVGERGSDIDHVVIGHGGVYTLNTKTHPGGSVWVGKHLIRVNGHRTDYLRNSRHEATRAARLLSAAVGFPVPVMPALVFLTGSLIPNVTIKQQPDDVFVYDRMDIPGVFKRAPHRMTPEQVEAVFEKARRSVTWRPAP